MNSRRWFHLYDVLDRRAQLDNRHVSHLTFDGSDRMVGETVVGPPIPSPPFSPFLGTMTEVPATATSPRPTHTIVGLLTDIGPPARYRGHGWLGSRVAATKTPSVERGARLNYLQG
ncbi:hypothetical protein Tco_0342930 [Tanacetum coccineum]